jgi:hypothetical protein
METVEEVLRDQDYQDMVLEVEVVPVVQEALELQQ